MGRTVAVIDGNSLMHRAFHAVPPQMTAPDGTPTNAVFGFLSMLLRFIEMEHPDAVICAFDAGKPEFRMKVIEQYKANRPPMDSALKVQFPVIEDILSSLHIPVVKQEGWEGDDILGTVSLECEHAGERALLVSGDKDVYQLVSESTHVVTTKRGMTDVAIYGPDEVLERYGVTPAQFIDFLGLKGDSVDNIPGVPGIGDVQAKKLLQAYGSLEGIYAHIDDLKGKQRETLIANKDLAFASREVATIVRDMDVNLDVTQVTFPAYTADEARASFSRYGMVTQLEHVLSFLPDGSGAGGSKPELDLPVIVEENGAWAWLDRKLDAEAFFGVALAQDDQESLFGASYTLCIAGPDEAALFTNDAATQALVRVISRGKCACFDAKSLLKTLIPDDTTEARLLDADKLASVRLFDCSLAAYLLDSSVQDYAMEPVAERYAPFAVPELSQADRQRRALVEAAAARAIAGVLADQLKSHAAEQVYNQIDLPLVSVLVEMERTGVRLDIERLQQMSRESHAELDELRNEIYAAAGEEFNIDSPTQLSRILFEKIGLKPKKKTQRGYSTDASVLRDLALVHPLPGLILKYREQAKLASTYLDALPPLRAADGLIHTHFNQMATTTGRLSSSDPNLQNIPVRTDFGRKVRQAFIPLRDDEVFLSADYSQIELRLLAHLSGDETMISAFCSGADFHTMTASQVFGVPVGEVTPQMRSRAKAVNFGIVYGQQAFGLSQSLKIPFREAQEFIDHYYETFPRVREYLDELVRIAHERGYAETLFGRRRYIAELNSANAQTRAFGERTAMNHPMQGTAADIIKIAMRRVSDGLREQHLDAQLMIQVHDELDFSVKAGDAEALRALVQDAMEHVIELKVPLLAEVSTGANWAEAH